MSHEKLTYLVLLSHVELTCLGLLSHKELTYVNHFHMRSIGHREHFAIHLTLGCLLQLLSAVTASQHFCLGVSAPCVPGSSPLSLPLWIPGQSLSTDVAGRLQEGLACPTPLSSSDLCGHWFSICCLPEVGRCSLPHCDGSTWTRTGLATNLARH